MKDYKYCYEGFLEFYFETGEICFPLLQDFRGIDKNGFYSWDWSFVFDKKPAYLIIFNQDNNIVYEGTWVFDIENTIKNKYFSSPKNIEPQKWKEYCIKKYKAKVYSNKPVDAEINQVRFGNHKISLFEKINNEWILIEEGDSHELKENERFVLRMKKKGKIGFSQLITDQVNNFIINMKNDKQFIYFTTKDKKEYKIETI